MNRVSLGLMEIVAFTRPDIYQHPWIPNATLPYQRVYALWQNDGFFGRHVGETDTTGMDERRLTLATEVGTRILSSLQRIIDGEVVNCARFGRDVLGMESTTDQPTTDPQGLPKVDRLSVGAVGLVDVEGYGFAHVMGYGLSDEALQVLSTDSELGFATNSDVLKFYRQIYPGRSVSLRQMTEAPSSVTR